MHLMSGMKVSEGFCMDDVEASRMDDVEVIPRHMISEKGVSESVCT